MTPKEKAKDLIDKFNIGTFSERCGWQTDIEQTLEAALKCADEIIENGFNPQLPYNYWDEVKQEINSLKQ